MKKTVSFYTLGCKVNQYETNAMEQQFIKNNYEIVENTQKADIYIINTCTVTNMAERKSRQMLRRVKEINPSAVLVVCGCYAQVAKNELEQIPEIDIILGINEKNEIVQIVENYMEKMAEKDKRSQEAEIDDVSKQKEFLDFGDVTYTEKNRAVVKVQDGCNMFCSYCIIPYARGRIRSRKIESVVSEIEKIANEDIKEVVITGIHVASYGKDFEDGTRLIDLLEQINKIEGLKRIRLGSLEPNLITEEFVQRLGNVDKICDHFHLSLQSGCDETLKRMNRKYTKEQYLALVDKMKARIPGIVLSTDIIVGFPGETEDDFEDTLDVVRKAKYDSAYTFIYSKRTGTPAARMEGQVAEDVVKERFNRLLQTVSDISHEHIKRYEGHDMDVLVEDVDDHDSDFLTGRMTNNILVHFKGDKSLIGTVVNVHMDECKGFYYMGTMND